MYRLCTKEFTMKDIATELSEKLESFYSNETFFNGLLHKTCKNAKECWKGQSEKVMDESKWNYFSLPYIGKNYKGELLCVGLNVHEGGGRNLQELQIRGIKDLLWHRIAVYSKILLDSKYKAGMENDFKELAKIFERIIYMDAVKCSPAGNKSTPTEKMAEVCPKYIFFKELEKIKPDNILIMSHPVAELIREAYKHIGGSKDFPGKKKDFDRYRTKIEGKSVNVYYIVHPGNFVRGFRTGLFKEFYEFLGGDEIPNETTVEALEEDEENLFSADSAEEMITNCLDGDESWKTDHKEPD